MYDYTLNPNMGKPMIIKYLDPFGLGQYLRFSGLDPRIKG